MDFSSLDDCSPTQWYEYLRNPEAVTPDANPATRVFDPVFLSRAAEFPTMATLPDDQPPREIPRESCLIHNPNTLNPSSDSADQNHISASNSPPSAINLEHLYHDHQSEARTPPLTSIPTPSPTRTFLPPEWCRVPQTAYNFGNKQYDFEKSERILFRVDGYAGQNIGDALQNRFPGLYGRDDPVLQEARGVVSCRLSFPGYPPNKAMQICATYYNKDRDPITRSKLAHDVAKKLEQYLELMRSSHMINATADNQWQIGEGFMHLNNMYLSELEFVSKGSVQPVIWVRVTDPGAHGN